MKKKLFIVGIDVSKETLDVFIHSCGYHFVIENNSKGFVELLKTVFEITCGKKGDILFCFENTGKYSKMLSVFLYTQDISFVMEPALAIKKSLGITRGKDDKVCARRIAKYAYEKRESLIPTILPGAQVDQIKSLLSLREKLVKHRTGFKNGLTDLHDCFEDGETDLIRSIQEQNIDKLNNDIEKIEHEIMTIIRTNKEISRNYDLIISVKGVGKINALYFLAFTANFTLFRNWRAYACYAGTAPFAYSSGKSKGRGKVHSFANKQVKAQLNMAARSAVRYNLELKEYYNKRTEIGKNKMSSMNIIRNKLIARVFAVVNRGTPYVDLHKFAA